MGFVGLLFPWGIILQALAIVHFIRRRPDTYWLYIILFLGPIGALVYIVAEVLPDLGLLRDSFKVFPRRKRIYELESMILDNPSAGNYEELADLYLEEGRFRRARECYDKAISSRTDSLDPFYRRALAAMQMGDYAAAVPDLERVVSRESKYDFHRALGLLADAYAQTGQARKPTFYFAKPRKCPPFLRPTTTMLRSCSRNSVSTKLAIGPSESWTRKRRFRVT